MPLTAVKIRRRSTEIKLHETVFGPGMEAHDAPRP